jgi:exosortase A
MNTANTAAIATASTRLAPGGAMAIFALCSLVFIYRDTFGSMAYTWSHSETFAHGAAVAPISGWLVWRRRLALLAVPRAPSFAGVPVLGALGLAWMAAHLAHVHVLAQYMAVAMLPCALLIVYGAPFATAIAFPLAFLLLAVPSGEVLIPPLIDFTASFTVGALQLTGVPVFRDHAFLSLPGGNWTVAEACSGLRYLIASVTLGALYAHLMYQSLWRRLAFIAVSVVLPILANGMRAYLIVMIGYWSDMRLATGIDHVIYGWLFFSIVLLTLFWIGSHWREEAAPHVQTGPVAHARPARTAVVACIATAAIWPALASVLASGPPPRAAALALSMPGLDHGDAVAPIRLVRFTHADAEFAQTFAPRVSLQIGLYLKQREDANLLAGGGAGLVPEWRVLAGTDKLVQIGGRTLPVREEIVVNDRQTMLVWRWYRQSGIDTSSAVRAKALLAAYKLLRQREDGAEIVVACAYEERPETAAAALGSFLTWAYPAISHGVDHASDK